MDFTGFEAFGADEFLLCFPFYHNSYFLQVGIKQPDSVMHGMGDGHSLYRLLFADKAFPTHIIYDKIFYTLCQIKIWKPPFNISKG